MFFDSDRLNKLEIKVCSTNERRNFNNRVFIRHPFFNGEKHWPTSTTICCFHCTEPFSGFPFPLPIKYDSNSKLYTCFGVFCSPNCAKAYLREHPTVGNTLCYVYLKQLAQELFSILEDIIAAPPSCTLKKFGGEYTIEQFRKLCFQLTADIKTHELPFLTCALAYELPCTNKAIQTNLPPVFQNASALQEIGTTTWIAPVQSSKQKIHKEDIKVDELTSVDETIIENDPSKSIFDRLREELAKINPTTQTDSVIPVLSNQPQQQQQSAREKNASVSVVPITNNNVSFTAAPPPKRRGRPRKDTSATPSAATATATATTAPKKYTTKKKKQATNHLSDEQLYSNPIQTIMDMFTQQQKQQE